MVAALSDHRSSATRPTRLTLTVHLTAAAAAVPALAGELADALHALGRHDGVTAAVTVDETPPLGVVVPLPRAVRAPLRVLTGSRRVLWHGHEVELTRLEFDLLAYLAGHPNRVHRRQALMSAVWGTSYVSERTVDVHIRRLRSKIDPTVPLVRTVRGVGYQFGDRDLVSLEP
ncbi:Transcriptional regulatory protein glnR [Actinokineospora spheciospongiae]|uniref:Transcriptional regulatory protein glnR n=1 Tax=Actinokineospora spheciospongiae TaxID=909613 RepID=W7IQS7_9PSEU|nr:winged helix-turn-helix domain-containing protein [Actinokineospora spheciospongiae]EWC58901.1 Transcriptional regulatory protein glnR [Actinokineospora spheciospongiae]PWW53765.1 transcriptional regulator [Actinokineospora spheciospongiae]